MCQPVDELKCYLSGKKKKERVQEGKEYCLLPEG